MPYIPPEDRFMFDTEIDRLIPEIENAGELNYVITRLCLGYWKSRGSRYQQIAEITGVLVNAKDEFYRRVAAPYEDVKIHENGDVYDR